MMRILINRTIEKSDLVVLYLFVMLSMFCILIPDLIFSQIFAIGIFLFVGFFVNKRSSVHMMFFLGYMVFIYVPAILHWIYSSISFELLYLTSLTSVFFLIWTKRTSFIPNSRVRDGTLYCYYISFVFILIILLLGKGEVFRATFAFFIMCMAMSFKQNDIWGNSFKFTMFLTLFFIYALTLWSGFGRLVTMGWLLLGVLIYLYSISFYINKYFFSIVPSAASVLLSNRDLLSLEFKGLDVVLEGSAFGPYKLASSFLTQFSLQGFDLKGFFDQVVFTLFVYVPRDIWPNKPYGFGFEYVVRHLDGYLIDAGHSIASTLVGNHLYFLGYLGVFTSLLMLFIVAKISMLLYQIKNLNGNGILIFSASMLALVWGGMTSFSERVFLPLAVFTCTYLLIKKLMLKNIRVSI